MVAVLAATACVVGLVPQAQFHIDFALQTVVLSLSLARTERDASLRERGIGLLVLPLVAALLAAVHAALFDAPLGDDAFLAVLVGLAIWVRRFGPLATRIGTSAIPPVVAILVVRGAATQPDGGYATWMAVSALCSALSVFVVLWVAGRCGLQANPAPLPPEVTTARGRLLPGTRVALQMAAALLLAGGIGRLVFGAHGEWVAITAFIVCSGARGTLDVLYKAVLRVSGAALGTVLGTALAGALGPHHVGSLVIIAAVITLATVLRTRNYGYWATGVTLALALLYGWQGGATGALLGTRLLAIVLGALLGLACSALLWPLSTWDIGRKRSADALKLLAPAWGSTACDATQAATIAARFPDAITLLLQVAPALRAHRRWQRMRRTDQPHVADAVDALYQCLEPVQALARAVAMQAAPADILRLQSALRAHGATARNVLQATGR